MCDRSVYIASSTASSQTDVNERGRIRVTYLHHMSSDVSSYTCYPRGNVMHYCTCVILVVTDSNKRQNLAYILLMINTCSHGSMITRINCCYCMCNREFCGNSCLEVSDVRSTVARTAAADISCIVMEQDTRAFETYTMVVFRQYVRNEVTWHRKLTQLVSSVPKLTPDLLHHHTSS